MVLLHLPLRESQVQTRLQVPPPLEVVPCPSQSSRLVRSESLTRHLTSMPLLGCCPHTCLDRRQGRLGSCSQQHLQQHHLRDRCMAMVEQEQEQ